MTKAIEPAPAYMLTGYKTIIVNALTIVLSLLMWPQITEIIPGQYVAILVAVVNGILRVVTKTPIFQATQATKTQMSHVGP